MSACKKKHRTTNAGVAALEDGSPTGRNAVRLLTYCNQFEVGVRDCGQSR